MKKLVRGFGDLLNIEDDDGWEEELEFDWKVVCKGGLVVDYIVVDVGSKDLGDGESELLVYE